jgi:signal transduction histidine kinase/putative methionine-R-sulfoxide reductase with GAF domain
MGKRADPSGRTRLREELVRALASCATEADIAQVLYSMLQPHFGYDVITVQVLEREGWLHNMAVDRGVLQDMVRGRVSESSFAAHYLQPRTVVVHPPQDVRVVPSRGPGTVMVPQTLIWVPVLHQDEAIGAVMYQLYVWREVPSEELALLEDVHASLSVILSNAYLNALTRNQAVSLSALNAVARALSSTHDEDGVARALYETLSTLIPVDRLELAVPDDHQPGRVRVILVDRGEGGPPRTLRRAAASRRLAGAQVLRTGEPHLLRRAPGEGEHRSAVWVPVVEGERPRAVLSLHSRRPDAYEQSTVTFLQQVADEVALALRNAWSYSAIEAQRRRLEVVNAVGRRLASSLDRWSITRTLREELARHLQFDLLTLATVTETPAGPVARGYAYDSGREWPLAAVPLSAAGPSRQAYESGRPVLIHRSPWAQALESRRRREETRVVGEGAVLDVTRPGGGRRVAARSMVWVPVRHGEQIRALLSLQSYRADAFDEWHVQLLEDVAAHVSLALATAEHFEAAQMERRRLEALHVLEMGVAQAEDEREIAEAVFRAACSFLDVSRLVLVYLDSQGRLTGYRWEPGRPLEALSPASVSRAPCFQRLMEVGHTLVEERTNSVEDGRAPWSRSGGCPMATQVVWVPLKQGGASRPGRLREPGRGSPAALSEERVRVIGALSAQRDQDSAFTANEIQLLESAAPVVGIALRTLRLHRSNQLALAHSVRIQEVAALAGHDLDGVVASIAEQARTMLGAAGTACWAFDDEGRVSAEAAIGDPSAAQVLAWSRQGPGGGRALARRTKRGTQGSQGWTLIPLWYADRLVGALGSVQAPAAPPMAAAPLDFSRHAAIAIENARLAAETRGRIHALEAVAAFADLDITRPDLARAEMCRLIERALSASGGALWLREGDEMVRGPGGRGAPRVPADPSLWDGDPARGGEGSLALPIAVEGEVVGMLTANAGASSPRETLRLTSVLAGQAALVLGRLRLVAALDRQAEMMNAILTHSPVGVVLEDAEGRIVYANPVVEGMYGVPATGLVGTPARDLPARAGGAVISDPDAGPDAPLELRLAERGTVVRVRRVSIPGSQERAAGVLTLHEDVTEQRALLEAKDLMLRAIGHEVRSPAAAMRATIAGLMQWDSLIDASQRHALLDEAYQQSDRLLSLVESQLIIAKLETGRFQPNPVPVALGPAFTQMLGVLRSRYGARVGAVELRVGPDIPDASCDPAHLDQVMTNLIGNALEYTNASRIAVSASCADGWLEVTVEDNGGGLPPDLVGRLFQKTGPAGRGRSRGGLGLGLYLCRLVVERSFRGRIWLARTGPDGTAFTFTVPAATVSGTPIARPASDALRILS